MRNESCNIDAGPELKEAPSFENKKKGGHLTLEQRIYLVKQHVDVGVPVADLAAVAKVSPLTIYKYVKENREQAEWAETQ